MVQSIYFLRHGTVGMDGLFIGSSDLPLTKEGIEQIKQSRLFLSRITFTKIYVSPLLRCIQSLKHLDIPTESEILTDLREINFGEWEKQRFDKLARKSPELIEKWQSDITSFTFPGGDSIADFHHRIWRLSELLHNDQSEALLIVAHGGVIRHLICSLLQLPFENYLLFDVKPGGVAKVQLYSQGGVLCGLNMGTTENG